MILASSTEVSVVVLTGVLALFTTGMIAVINSWISARAGIDETLRSQRLAAYPELWKETGAVSRWPRMHPTHDTLKTLHNTYRSWYYNTGGLFMSEQARARYGEVQELLATLLEHPSSNATDPLAGDAYTDLMDATSTLRTALTQDLDTRRRRSLASRRQQARWHQKAAETAELLLAKTAGRKSTFAPRQPTRHPTR